MSVDHINHDTLDNRKVNLRLCTIQENQRNQKIRVGTSSKFKGVSWDRRLGRWQVSLRSSGKSVYLGVYINEVEAALAYNKAAQQYFGAFACLNSVSP